MAGGTALLFLLGLESGSKNLTMLALFPPLAPLLVTNGYRLWIVPLGVLATVIYLTVVVPLIGWSREAFGSRPDNQGMVLLRILVVGVQASVIQPARGEDAWNKHIATALFDPVSAAYLVDEVQLRYVRDEPLTGAMAALVPGCFGRRSRPFRRAGSSTSTSGGSASRTTHWADCPRRALLGLRDPGRNLGNGPDRCGDRPPLVLRGIDALGRYLVWMWIYVSTVFVVGDYSSEATSTIGKRWQGASCSLVLVLLAKWDPSRHEEPGGRRFGRT